jgi:HlyD family secretion protein
MVDNMQTNSFAAGNQKANGIQNSGRRPARRGRWLWMIILFVAVAVTVTVLVAATRKTGSVTTTSSTFTARRDNLTITVSEGGSIRAHKSIQYKCQVERRGGDVTILSIVPAGSYITQQDVDNGMVLVELDSSSLKERLTQEKMELAGDRENATSAEEAHHIQELQNESDIADAQLKVKFALMDFQKYLGETVAVKFVEDVNSATNLNKVDIASLLKDPNSLGGEASQELKRLTDNITLANSRLQRAEDTLDWTEKLYAKEYVSSNELQADQLDYDSLKIQKEQAVISMELFKRYDFPKQVEQLLSNYIEAGRQLERTYAECRSRMAQAQARLSNAQERFRSQQSRVNELEKQIEYCTIKAKAPGLVVYGTGGEADIFRAMRRGGMGSGIIAEGEIVTEGQVIISMPDTASMVAEISVHETEVDKVRKGQPATIVMDAFPDKVLQGEVLEVAPLPDEQRGWMNPDLKVYKTLVKIDGSHDFLRSRMSCKVQILVENLKDVVVVPIQVVSNRGGKKVCFVATPQGPQEHVVRTGSFNDTFVQIVEGLQQGEEVMLNPPLFTESTVAVGFQQQQPLPESITEAGQEQADEGTEAQDQPGEQTEGRAGRRGERSRGGQVTSTEGQQESGESQGPAGPPQGRQFQFQLTDEMIDRMLAGMKQFNPEKAQELEKLRKDDPEKFKAELKEMMRNMRNMMMRQGQGRNRTGGQGTSDTESR